MPTIYEETAEFGTLTAKFEPYRFIRGGSVQLDYARSDGARTDFIVLALDELETIVRAARRARDAAHRKALEPGPGDQGA